MLNKVPSSYQKSYWLMLKNITGIAFLLGFGDTSAFTKAFKKWTKMSPSEFKKIEQLK